jgi:hypothetical protein
MLLGASVGQVQAGHIHSVLDHFSQDRGGVGGGSDGADDLGMVSGKILQGDLRS